MVLLSVDVTVFATSWMQSLFQYRHEEEKKVGWPRARESGSHSSAVNFRTTGCEGVGFLRILLLLSVDYRSCRSTATQPGTSSSERVFRVGAPFALRSPGTPLDRLSRHLNPTPTALLALLTPSRQLWQLVTGIDLLNKDTTPPQSLRS